MGWAIVVESFGLGVLFGFVLCLINAAATLCHPTTCRNGESNFSTQFTLGGLLKCTELSTQKKPHMDVLPLMELSLGRYWFPDHINWRQWGLLSTKYGKKGSDRFGAILMAR